MAVVTQWNLGGRPTLAWWCPGCRETHSIYVDAQGWVWNGSVERPTISPSILARFSRDVPPAEPEAVVCHSFIRDGVVEFLGDCTHDLAGRSVPMDPAHADPYGPPETEPAP